MSSSRLLLSLSILFLFTALARAEVGVPEPPQLSAPGYLLVDHHSGAVLAAADPDQRMEPASLTKIMTAYVVFHEIEDGNLSLDDEVFISEKAWRTKGSRMFVEVNTRVSVKDLLLGVIVQSGNDACVALAEHIAGSEDSFADLMNRHGERLGMTGTHYANSSGLPHPDQYTTPRDVAIISDATIREYPAEYAWYKLPDFTFNNIKQANRNRLLFQDPSVDGVKTGHTDAAGWCLAASAARDGQRLTSVVMGTNSDRARSADSLALLNYGFRFFETHRPYVAGETVERLRVWSGRESWLPVGPAGAAAAVTIPRGRYAELTAELVPLGSIEAPVEQGQVVGEIVFRLAGEEVQRHPAVALAEIPRGGVLRRLTDSVLRLF
ncbi:MAG: D-alanyl-D-alanine carboxypeptidase [Chromatiaceae bacterium]|nr:MAG: D-alanyl-D-alanine carboxypeptidase [Chromatiaceae bacterium]